MNTRAVFLLTVAALPLLLGAAAPPVDEPAPTLVATYQVTAEEVSTGPDGATETDGASGIVELTCAGSTCRVTGEPYRSLLRGLPLELGTSAVGESTSPGAATACGDGIGERRIEVTADATGFRASLTQDSLGWNDCGDGSEAYSHAREITWTGALVTGPVCMFSEAGCRATESASALATGDPAAPSVLSALATPATAGTAPIQLGLAALMTLVLVLLVAFPTALLNSAVESGSERAAGWWSARQTRRHPAADGEDVITPRRQWTASWWWAGAGVVAASVISAFVDPQFGLNPGSGRMVLSILISFAVDVVLGWAAVVWIMSRMNPGVTHSYSFRPLTLLVVVAAVVFTRVTGFEPGIVFGLVAGVAFGALAGRSAEAKSALVTLGYAFAWAAVAWVVYGAVADSAGDSFLATLLVEALAAVAVGGMAALPVALIPLRGMPGYPIWRWSRWLWAGCYAVGLLAFFIVLMPMPFAWDEVGWELGAWVGVYLVYAAAAVVAWLVLARPWQKDESASPEVTAEPDAEAVDSGADRLGA
ncbi:hypothetical protein [uncultured Microbacterium sp.]|nr:hypothetical protein [uncultured Microbacterium sp.]